MSLEQFVPELCPFAAVYRLLGRFFLGYLVFIPAVSSMPIAWRGRRLVERSAEVADQRLLDLGADLLSVLAHEPFYRRVEHPLIVVVDTDTGRRIGPDRDPVRGVHPFHPDVDGKHAQVQPFTV